MEYEEFLKSSHWVYLPSSIFFHFQKGGKLIGVVQKPKPVSKPRWVRK
jgi:hypothetical protein